ncbi:NAD(P)/FAD-dependent oxidoreductase [Sulfurimonas paralvinellae]|uniref:FAD-binding oxidoreductase n=1 Tax=Sulfurimonas paralvinellae TaxID=317658 RepID=A0A7M1B781_9BACT|nr:FAD-dependent oxidoreductase [Sulfurimonas paralvinellae]QOP45564.1 FAD-binding oxidoreductase [Sulfurimonas paralvinellae]
MYDVAVIGAGINGCSVAYEFTQTGKNVIVFDKEGVASGGSGAAGAFISPKFSRAGELKEIIEDAFVYSMEYYEKNFQNFFTKAQLLHIAKDEVEEETLKIFKEKTSLPLKIPEQKVLDSLTQSARVREYVSLDAGVVAAKGVCQKMIAAAKFVTLHVEDLVWEDGYWLINETYAAREVVLATGAYKTIINEPYIGLRGVWGHRIDVKSTFENPYSIHQFVSISPTNQGITAIGATHNVHYHPEINKEPYDVKQGREELLEKASRTVKIDDVEIVKDYMGLRSGSHDYMPLVGPLVLSRETLECCEKKIRVKRPDFENFLYYPHLTMINGSGGYGFVLAPYLAKILKDYIVSDKHISQRIVPARFFARWAKKKI